MSFGQAVSISNSALKEEVEHGRRLELNHVGMTIGNRNATLRHFQSIGVGVSVGLSRYYLMSRVRDR